MFGNDQVLFVFHGPFGIRVEVHSSILMLGLLVLAFGTQSAQQLLWGVVTVAILIVSIFLHEMGHALGTIVQGLPVRRIVLYGGGGYCERAASASARQQELIVAMGPIVNLILWSVASLLSNHLWGLAMGAESDYGSAFYNTLFVLERIASINLFLAIFNLLPVQPLDGGKLFQLGLMRVVAPVTATRIAGGIGLVFAVLWIPAMIWMFFTIGWVLFFIPSIRQHYEMYTLQRVKPRR